MSWKHFRATPLGELLTGTAHEAHPTDITTPLPVRFAGRTILALHVALEKAATVRVAFDAAGRPQLGGIRHIKQRASSELSEVLRSEAASTGAKWVVVVAATGWQAVLGQRSARPEAGEASTAFARHRLLFESPEIVVPRAQVERVYTAVDHPLLDKSVVFSLRRRELEELFSEIRKAGLQVASVRIAVAAQLELWLAAQGEAALARDLLITDGLSALLLNTDQGDFVPPRGAVEPEQPRQAVQRPSAVDEDVGRFIAANAGRSVTFIGPEELCATVKKSAHDAEIVRPPEAEAHDTQLAVLSRHVQHDLNFEAKEVRPAIPRSYRRFVYAYAGAAFLMATLGIANTLYAVRAGYQCFRLERETAQRASEQAAFRTKLAAIEDDFAEANMLRAWVGANYHAQRLCYGLLKEIPPTAGLDRLHLEMKDGQLTLTFVVLGDPDAQLSTHRAVERAIKQLKHKIGGEDLPVGAAGVSRAVQYRMHIIVQDASETTNS